jgi:SAM-dependent methyltransferase
MGLSAWYNAAIVPRLIRCACGAPGIMKIRQRIVPLAQGRVLELGCGGGINQAFYDPQRVSALVGIDPSDQGLGFARDVAGRGRLQAEFIAAEGESLPLGDGGFDCVVCTYTLCSVRSPAATLAELHRVLKPGGTVLFAEHGLAPDAGVQRWQRRIEPVWKRLAGGCHLTRPISSAFAAAGFAVERQGADYLAKTPRFAGWMEWGIATKST